MSATEEQPPAQNGHHRKNRRSRRVRITAGWLFSLLGVAGLFLPVLQGILFLIVALLLLAPESRILRRILARCRVKYPALYRRAVAMRRRLFGG